MPFAPFSVLPFTLKQVTSIFPTTSCYRGTTMKSISCAIYYIISTSSRRYASLRTSHGGEVGIMTGYGLHFHSKVLHPVVRIIRITTNTVYATNINHINISIKTDNNEDMA
jgi:hypothetical protein